MSHDHAYNKIISSVLTLSPAIAEQRLPAAGQSVCMEVSSVPVGDVTAQWDSDITHHVPTSPEQTPHRKYLLNCNYACTYMQLCVYIHVHVHGETAA